MLKHLCEGQNRTYVTLDNMMARTLAQTDPVLFFQTYKLPILIDEVQYAPELFAQIKILCDESCPGLCPKCGKNLNEGACGCPEKEIDPRLSALAELLDD